MYEEFKSLIYKSKEEEQAVIDEVIFDVIKKHSCTKEELLNALSEDEPNEIQSDYHWELRTTENYMLFKLAVDKIGRKLWSNKAWHNKTCRRRCPFGDICRKRLIEIEGELFCYGQLYIKHNIYVSSDSIKELYPTQHIRVIEPDGTIFIDNRSPKFDIQIFASCLGEYEFFILDFGDKFTYPNKIYGNNVIRLLQKGTLKFE